MSADNIIIDSIKEVNALIPSISFMERDLKESSLVVPTAALSSLNSFREGMNKILSMLVQGAAQMHSLQTKQIEDVRTELNSNVAEVKEQLEIGLADAEFNIVETLNKRLDALKANEDYKAKVQKICMTKAKILANTIMDMARSQNINLSASTCKIDTIAKIISFIPAALDEFV